MRLRPDPGEPESDTGGGHPTAGARDDRPDVGLRELLERQRAELEGHLAEADRRLEHVAEREARLEELQRTLEGERLEREAREADLQQRLEEASAEHAREHGLRLELEQRLAAEVAARQRTEQELDALEESYTGPPDGGFRASERTLEGPIAHATPAGRRKMRGRRLLRWRRRSSLPCAVCRRPRPAMSDAEATASGWELAGAGALCPTCRREGWQFPPGATVPFRAAGPRSSV
jgi:hypothetical protein